MTDENTNLDVENILSSIKDILEEEETKTADKSDNTSQDGTFSVLDEVLDGDVSSDIIELSDDMRIKAKVEEIGANSGVLDAEDAYDIDIKDDLDANSPMGEALQKIDSEEVKPLQQDVDDRDVFEISPAEDFDLNDNGESDEKTIDDLIDFEEENLLDASDREENIAEDIVDVASAKTIDDILVDDVIEAENTDGGDNFAEIQQANKVDLPEVEVKESLGEDKNEAVDASANIISNFAKLFAKGGERTETTLQVSKIENLGDGSKTLEGFVGDAIVKVIGADIANQWNDGADYRVIAETEIKSQVTDWLNDNLPKMVENIVRDEIERVMEKVGS